MLLTFLVSSSADNHVKAEINLNYFLLLAIINEATPQDDLKPLDVLML